MHTRTFSCPFRNKPIDQSNPNVNPVYYSTYLNLETLLKSQCPKTEAHDEVLFITTHQTFEIWFKQVLFEMKALTSALSQPHPKLQTACELLERICRILSLLVDQFGILETMTPSDFLRFRFHLGAASGFQSVQFKLLEIGMGLSEKQRVNPLSSSLSAFQAEDREMLEIAMKQPSLITVVDSWLSKFDTERFWSSYSSLSENIEHLRNGMTEAEFGIQDHQLSFQSFRAAIMIHLFREKFGHEYTILSRLTEMDALMVKWRFHHAVMVQRIIGRKMGTGGSSGVDYLRETATKHLVFTDLTAVSQYLVVDESISL